jgi:hypothetical protein
VRRNFKKRAERCAERERHRKVAEQGAVSYAECDTQANSATVAHFCLPLSVPNDTMAAILSQQGGISSGKPHGLDGKRPTHTNPEQSTQ